MTGLYSFAVSSLLEGKAAEIGLKTSDESLIPFLQVMLKNKPENRHTADQLYQHPFISHHLPPEPPAVIAIDSFPLKEYYTEEASLGGGSYGEVFLYSRRRYAQGKPDLPQNIAVKRFSQSTR